MRGGAPGDGTEVRSGVELRDDQLDGDLRSLILERSKGHSDLHFTIGWYHTWKSEKEKQTTEMLDVCVLSRVVIFPTWHSRAQLMTLAARY